MNSDLTFLTSEKNKNLSDRFGELIKDARFFDVLVGHFSASGFYTFYKSLENTEKIRILAGINTNRKTRELIRNAKFEQPAFPLLHAELKEQLENAVTKEMEESDDNPDIEEGILKFVEWLKSKKVEIRVYPAEDIQTKLYLMTFAEGGRDTGRVITGSSNFTQAGLIGNFEFNVALKNPADYKFALQKFNELWKDAVDVKERYIDIIQTKTWLNNTITPYELYLKFLYEYFTEDVSQPTRGVNTCIPSEFKAPAYQEQAVVNAKKILEEYGGVFISDVVGLGNTYITAMLAQQLDGGNLVIAPPALLDKDNPGSWVNMFRDFNVPATFLSPGKPDVLALEDTGQWQNVFIADAHRSRTEATMTYEMFAQICRGKRVILVTTMPYNNTPKDILGQLKLFQKAGKSTIPNLADLESFFTHLEEKFSDLDRHQDYETYVKTRQEIAKEIREKVLKYLMVRRTYSEVVRYFAKDLANQKLKFPEVDDPEPVFYKLNDKEDATFNKTIELAAREFKYARYTPMLYYTGKITRPEELAQKNLGKFMKILLLKRLESSFYVFQNTLCRFIVSYENFLREFEKGDVYVSRKYTDKVFESPGNDNGDAVLRLIDEDKTQKYDAKEFKKEFQDDLIHDLQIFRDIFKLWEDACRDTKLITFKEKLRSSDLFRQQRLIIFSESKETVDYLAKHLEEEYPGKVLSLTGSSVATVRKKVIENFDAGARSPKDDYRILITTDIVSEGVNLHRSNVVINYDIPWSPTRLRQRVSPIIRVDSKFDKVYTFTFFPAKQTNDQIKLKETAEAKISAFISLLGADAPLLTGGEPVQSHELFHRLLSRKTITGEDETEESELKYLQTIKDVRDNNPGLFEKIKQIPQKARTAKPYSTIEPQSKLWHCSGKLQPNLPYPEDHQPNPPCQGGTKSVGENVQRIEGFTRQSHKGEGNFLLTYFRKGKLQKFFRVSAVGEPEEIDFLSAARLLEVNQATESELPGSDFYELLGKNKKAFEFAREEILGIKSGGDSNAATPVLNILMSNGIKSYEVVLSEYFINKTNKMEF